MAEVERRPPGLPDEVPQELRLELERLQRQIKILLNNYQVRILITQELQKFCWQAFSETNVQNSKV